LPNKVGFGIINPTNLPEDINMLEIHKKIVLDEDHRPFAVQIPIDEFERLEEVIENYGLSNLMDAVKDEERLSVNEAQQYYKSLKTNVEG
jgi:RelB Antitoxin